MLPLESFGIHKQRKDGISLWCKQCNRDCTNKYRSTEEGRRKHSAQEVERGRSNPESARKRANAWRSKNLVRARAKSNEGRRKRMESPEYRKKKYARSAEWAKQNPTRVAANSRSNRLLRRNAQPKWLTAIHKAQIQEFYDIAAAKTMQTGAKHHVDHMFAIKANQFNGLHVPWNLQVLTAAENDEKWIKVPPRFADQVWSPW
jgi:hypothetical protein